jgi:ankyrin repeat protein
VSQKKDMFIASARHAVAMLPRELWDLAAAGGAQEKLDRDPHKTLKGVTYSVGMFVDKVVGRVQAVLDEQQAAPAAEFLVDSAFRRISLAMLDARSHAASSLRHYMENPSSLINGAVNLPLVYSHRYYLAFLRLKLQSAAAEERAAVALSLCRATGLIESSLEERNGLGEKRIISAANDGDVEALKLLLAARANVNTVNESDKWTPLISAASMGNESAVEVLCDAGADLEAADNRTALTSAAFYGMRGSVEILLRRGASAEAADKKGATPLLLAAMRNHAGVVELLCRHVKDVDRQDTGGCSALMFAAEYGHAAVVRQLLAAGADPNRANGVTGGTALHVAANFGHKEVRALWRRIGKDPSEEGLSGQGQTGSSRRRSDGSSQSSY